jgi:hypothetical protein
MRCQSLGLNRAVSGLEVLLQCVSAGEMVAVMQALKRPFLEYGGKFPHMLVAMDQKSSLRWYFSQNQMVAIPIFGSVISMDRFETACQRTHLKYHLKI